MGNCVTFEDMPRIMSQILDQMKSLNVRFDKLEAKANEASANPPADKPMISTDDVCKLLGVSRITIYRMVARGEFPGYKSGKSYKFYKDDIISWLESCKTNSERLIYARAEEYFNSRL